MKKTVKKLKLTMASREITRDDIEMTVEPGGELTEVGGKNPKNKEAQIIDIDWEELVQLEDRLKGFRLRREDCELLLNLLYTFFHFNRLLEEKNLSIKRLRRLLWGQSEKSANILEGKNENARGVDSGADSGEPGDADMVAGGAEEEKEENQKPKKKDKKPGHGRNGVDRYRGAEEKFIALEKPKAGDICPDCEKGKVYELGPNKILRLRGCPPIRAVAYRAQRVRCASCQRVFSAQLPTEVGEKKYDEQAGAMISLLKYGYGMPFHRLGVLQGNLGIPLPPSTQWEVVRGVSRDVEVIYRQLLWEGAQGELVHNDDTTVKILELLMENKKGEGTRKGMFSTGIVCKRGNHRIALFFSGRNHAGENLTQLLEHRDQWLPPPLQMCDALSMNLSSKFKTVLAHCLLHGRRNFVDTLHVFPDESRYVIQKIGEVYQKEAVTRELGMTPSQRLDYHCKESGPIMDELKTWLGEQFESKTVEPNSSLGKAIRYMLKHWSELTLFLREPGAPLDNNIVERSLKTVILNRKNAYFFKTLNGSAVGDILMSIIQTCRFEEVNAFEYLTVLQRYAHLLQESSADWLPWNYRQTMAKKILK